MGGARSRIGAARPSEACIDVKGADRRPASGGPVAFVTGPDPNDSTAAATTPRGVLALSGVRQFAHTENASASILLAATVAALVWANSPWSAAYNDLWSTELALRVGSDELTLDLQHWVNDGLMAFFFFVAGLEIRREIDMGDFRERSASRCRWWPPWAG